MSSATRSPGSSWPSSGSAVPLAFWIDSATYLASAALIGTIVVGAASTRPGQTDDGRTIDTDRRPSVRAELAAGWQFLRHETVLLANTLQGVVGQFALGIAIALTPSFVQMTFSQSGFGWQAAYGFLETALGLGNLIGGFTIGLIGARFAKGRMVIAGYALWGSLIFLFALSGNLGVALGLTFGQGVAGMIFIIPSQTLFQERTPSELMGRVVGLAVRARVRVDDHRDAARIDPGPAHRAGAGDGHLRAGDGRGRSGGAPRAGGPRRVIGRRLDALGTLAPAPRPIQAAARSDTTR